MRGKEGGHARERGWASEGTSVGKRRKEGGASEGKMGWAGEKQRAPSPCPLFFHRSLALRPSSFLARSPAHPLSSLARPPAGPLFYTFFLTLPPSRLSFFRLFFRPFFSSFCAAKCVDQYCAQRVAQYEGTPAARAIDPRLESVVSRMFQRCFDDKQFTQAIGIAIEARRLDVVRQALAESADVQGALAYTLSIARNLIVHQGFRNEVLRVLIEVQERQPAPDYEFMCRCFVFLNDAVAVASVLNRLLRGDEVRMRLRALAGVT